MWKEIFIDDEEGIQKFVDIDNSDGCIAKINPTTREMILHILGKKDAHLFMFDNGTFEILLAFVRKPEYVLCLRCVIKWDYFDQTIDPNDALEFVATKEVEYLKERNIKLRMAVFSDEKVATLPDQHILEWYGDSMIPIYETYGAKIRRYKDYVEVEVI